VLAHPARDVEARVTDNDSSERLAEIGANLAARPYGRRGVPMSS